MRGREGKQEIGAVALPVSIIGFGSTFVARWNDLEPVVPPEVFSRRVEVPIDVDHCRDHEAEQEPKH
jgi:hypothetical protein